MKTEVEVDRNMKVMKDLLAEESGYSLRQAFKSADVNNTGFLTTS
jgi:hypothetical protein